MIWSRLPWSYGCLLVVGWLVDRLFKQLAIKQVASDQGGIFYLVFNLNRQAVFNLPLDSGLIIILSSLTLVAVVAVAVYSWRQELMVSWLGALFLLIGGLSNLLDRWQVGGVIDTFVLGGNLYFNLADIYLLVGIILLVIANRRKTI